MSALDIAYALCLVGVGLYIALREPPRLLLVPLTLMSFFLLYGIGHFIYYAGAEDIVLRVRENVTVCLIIMWPALIAGVELARLVAPSMSARAQRTIRDWNTARLSNDGTLDPLLAGIGIAAAAFILGMFLFLGKPSQMLGFLALESTLDKQKYRLELGGQGGYVYHTLIASIAPFLSFLLLLKAKATHRGYFRAAGVVLCIAIFAGKFGTYHKVPWIIYTLQLVVVYQAGRRLELGLGRALGFAVIFLSGTVLATAVLLPDLDAVGIFEWIAYRFFEVNNEVIYQTFYVYPDHLPHAWGMNIGIVQRIFGEGELVSAHSHVANFWGADGATFDAFFIGDAWVDFSYGGVFVMSLFVGFVVKMVDLFIMSFGKTPLAVALLGSSMYGLFQLQVTSAFTAFLSGGLILIPLVAILSTSIGNDLMRASGGPSRLASGEKA